MRQRYLIALGSNKRHHRHGSPPQVLRAALAALAEAGVEIAAAAPVLANAPLGPSLRRYANSAALVVTELAPDELLNLLKTIERQFGRRPGGQRWASRVLDLDLVLWSGGAWSSPGLTIPHAAFRERDFVLTPALALAPVWRDPLTNLSLRQLKARLTRPRPMPR
ncbi:2-amino-4-hydroxy-6-hydroxymethyldihydropteridine diphosphokinase [Novosphingobium ginsenosidimutans]|uniref:2-amino-4-hydroxy-6-hydroxymethyldihydropteridine pyrophosphokinase n=1 Tax=Novosphingobium ginsenosidimutans TaxID=1176536 RepID=A0A5B8S1B4_9SPHN|nr:2-amino-4-hydroxy-6-hydroxymethyldihydropteridine diphosphokinase [Novosphingobium ginsenosidimutans]QEA15299.1 2-amino-4-hydroxy-6-hydroxymethyldihydropteridine diphosphokinase [Novosphingobium ginsenosidimutans]